MPDETTGAKLEMTRVGRDEENVRRIFLANRVEQHLGRGLMRIVQNPWQQLYAFLICRTRQQKAPGLQRGKEGETHLHRYRSYTRRDPVTIEGVPVSPRPQAFPKPDRSPRHEPPEGVSRCEPSGYILTTPSTSLQKHISILPHDRVAPCGGGIAIPRREITRCWSGQRFGVGDVAGAWERVQGKRNAALR
jgi:hypothetical protein